MKTVRQKDPATARQNEHRDTHRITKDVIQETNSNT